MEFLRFGSSIPGGYHGCCAVCIIQNFNYDPAQKASIQLVSGDGGGGIFQEGQLAFAGPTYADIFKTRIRIGTFSTRDMPDHAFFAILTENQVNNSIGKKWLALLKEEGFEFLRTQSNSVYTGNAVPPEPNPGYVAAHKNHIFALFRNIQHTRVEDPLLPPAAWTALPEVIPEAWQAIDPTTRKELTDAQTEFGRTRWHATGPTKLLTEADIRAADAPVIMAGLRSKYPPQRKETRERLIAGEKAQKERLVKTVDPFATALKPASAAKPKAKALA